MTCDRCAETQALLDDLNEECNDLLRSYYEAQAELTRLKRPWWSAAAERLSMRIVKRFG